LNETIILVFFEARITVDGGSAAVAAVPLVDVSRTRAA
jgi:hypothetical protein